MTTPPGNHPAATASRAARTASAVLPTPGSPPTEHTTTAGGTSPVGLGFNASTSCASSCSLPTNTGCAGSPAMAIGRAAAAATVTDPA